MKFEIIRSELPKSCIGFSMPNYDVVTIHLGGESDMIEVFRKAYVEVKRILNLKKERL